MKLEVSNGHRTKTVWVHWNRERKGRMRYWKAVLAGVLLLVLLGGYVAFESARAFTAGDRI